MTLSLCKVFNNAHCWLGCFYVHMDVYIYIFSLSRLIFGIVTRVFEFHFRRVKSWSLQTSTYIFNLITKNKYNDFWRSLKFETNYFLAQRRKINVTSNETRSVFYFNHFPINIYPVLSLRETRKRRNVFSESKYLFSKKKTIALIIPCHWWRITLGREKWAETRGGRLRLKRYKTRARQASSVKVARSRSREFAPANGTFPYEWNHLQRVSQPSLFLSLLYSFHPPRVPVTAHVKRDTNISSRASNLLAPPPLPRKMNQPVECGVEHRA